MLIFKHVVMFLLSLGTVSFEPLRFSETFMDNFKFS